MVCKRRYNFFFQFLGSHKMNEVLDKLARPVDVCQIMSEWPLLMVYKEIDKKCRSF